MNGPSARLIKMNESSISVNCWQALIKKGVSKTLVNANGLSASMLVPSGRSIVRSVDCLVGHACRGRNLTANPHPSPSL